MFIPRDDGDDNDYDKDIDDRRWLKTILLKRKIKYKHDLTSLNLTIPPFKM
jgi:hypothetical protein